VIAGKMGGWERQGQAQGEGTGDGGFQMSGVKGFKGERDTGYGQRVCIVCSNDKLGA